MEEFPFCRQTYRARIHTDVEIDGAGSGTIPLCTTKHAR